MPHTDPKRRKEIAAVAGEKSAATKKAKIARASTPRISPRALSAIEEYDEELGRPTGWGDAKRREEVRGELVLNESRAVALEQARHDAQVRRDRYVEKTELTKMAGLIRDAWWREVSALPNAVLPLLSDLPGEVRARIKDALTTQVAAAGERVRQALLA